MIVDQYGRGVSYLRLSVTDRCNLRCFYCRNCKYLKFIPHQEILTYEEMFQIIQVGVDLGIQKIRLTGGEPFVRRDFLYFLARLRHKFPFLDLRVTTNGTLIANKVLALKDMGINCINISLDTLKPEKFQEITGRDFYHHVRAGIDRCLEENIRVKINVVALKGVNDDELEDFVQFALTHPVDIRFIEFMPIGGRTMWNRDFYWPAKEILKAVQKITPLEPVEICARTNTDHASANSDTSGPARIFALKEGRGRLGVISPLSDHFCDRCNRLRITPDGKLRTCLFSDKEYRLLPLLRSPKLGLVQLRKVLERAGRKKPLGYNLLSKEKNRQSVCQRVMSSIGG
ncbi:GTP 3',8-cyclase MoaA [Desulfovulcanus sp.]